MTALVLSPQEKDPFKIVAAVNQLAQGRSNAVGTVTLAANAASTTVSATNCAAGSAIFLFPQTANAAAEWKNGTMYVLAANVTKQQFVITHANNAQNDRIFWWMALG
jgi:hypothetical protein